jgi:hypothetical protein
LGRSVGVGNEKIRIPNTSRPCLNIAMLAALQKKCLPFRLKRFNDFVESTTKTSEGNGCFIRNFLIGYQYQIPNRVAQYPFSIMGGHGQVASFTPY